MDSLIPLKPHFLSPKLNSLLKVLKKNRFCMPHGIYMAYRIQTDLFVSRFEYDSAKQDTDQVN